MLKNRWLRRLITLGALGATLTVATTAASIDWVRSSAAGHIYAVDAVPAAPVALVLGAQVNSGGQPSPFLEARLEVARQLWAAGKVKAILVSGDHANWDYDEPGSMMVWLVAHGVPASRVVLDHAGFDTYDSCARAREVFGVRQAIVVTQTFHIERAVALCRTLGIDSTGVGDESVRAYRQIWLRGEIREEFAAVKAAGDVLSGRDPIFLGKRETGVDDAIS
ncbi:vancomycin permeability regulator SanA [Actinoplanes lutulentus]|uniref:SanA/YdcF family protein n=1 Tax=Actinoplanes lutulentus TaxID=1287878 RepID=UPI001834FC03|nr:ElyC/SanA/YdcF family protein [Actinoplanes lutulentus]MBB2943048.1 vancomycin permeability regulator SanA [Actinoplanes lutulentus]